MENRRQMANRSNKKEENNSNAGRLRRTRKMHSILTVNAVALRAKSHALSDAVGTHQKVGANHLALILDLSMITMTAQKCAKNMSWTCARIWKRQHPQ
jgi:hypothetical protein